MAAESDAPRILMLLRNFHAAGDFDFPFQAARMDAFVRGAIASPDGAVFLTGDPAAGVLVATRVESPMTPHACAMERLIWVEPSARGCAWSALIDAFEEWGRSTRCQRAMLFSQELLRGAAVGRLFRRRGYQPLETAYSKSL